jgi:transcriptional regulator with XRE-family HTH domain
MSEQVEGSGDGRTLAGRTPGVGLRPNQVVALNALLEGKSQSEAARLAGCSRQAVNQWTHDDLEFRAALEIGRERLLAAAEEERIKAAKAEARSLGNARKLAAVAAERAMARIVKRVSLPRDDKDFLEIRPFEAVALMDAAVKVSGEHFGASDEGGTSSQLSLAELAQQVIDRQQAQFGGPIEVAPDTTRETTEKLEGLGGPSEQTNGGGT